MSTCNEQSLGLTGVVQGPYRDTAWDAIYTARCSSSMVLPTTTTTTTTAAPTTSTSTSTSTTPGPCIDPTSGLTYPAYPPSLNIMGEGSNDHPAFGPTTYVVVGTLSPRPLSTSCYYYTGDPIYHTHPADQDQPHQEELSYTSIIYRPELGDWGLQNEHFGFYTGGGGLASPVGTYTGGDGLIVSFTIS